jgi:hypothetical protein
MRLDVDKLFDNRRLKRMEEMKNVLTDDRRAALVGHLVRFGECLYLDGAEDSHNGFDVENTFHGHAAIVEKQINKIIDSVLADES